MLVLGIYFVNIDREGADSPGELTGSQTADGDLSEATAEEQLLANLDGSKEMTGARIKREEQRSREVEELQREASNEENSAEEKVEANDKSIEILAFTDNEKELESLLKEQGYSDAFVFSQDQNNVQIMVQANELSNDEAVAIMATAREKLELNERAEVSVKFEPIEE